MAMSDEKQEKMVLCGANSYDMKYYFNEKFNGIPESIKNELHILCVLFTEEAGGIFTIGFTPSGNVVMDTRAEEGDLLYDEIGSALLIKKLRREKQEVFQSLEIYYRVTFLHQNPAELLDDYDDEM